jgi:ABC-type multidrug transport system fused ATPase/permease subunit
MIGLKSIEEFYNQRIVYHQTELKKVKQQLGNIVVARLLVFLSILGSIYLFWGNLPWVIIFPIFLAGMFMGLLAKNAKLSFRKYYVEACIRINQNEIRSLQGDYSFTDNGMRFSNPKHAFAHDIDLFGEGGFFERINRTATEEGAVKLKELLISNHIHDVIEKQMAYKELSAKTDFRERFMALASARKKIVDEQLILSWAKDFKSIVPAFMRIGAGLFALLSVAAIVLLSIELINVQFVIAWFVAGVFITGIFLKKIQTLSHQLNSFSEVLKINEQLLVLIEEEKFDSARLNQLKAMLNAGSEKVSEAFTQLNKAIDLFNNRNNLIVAMIGNGFFLWDIQSTLRLQQWMLRYQNNVEDWLEVIYNVDAAVSMGNYVYNHPYFNFPEVDKQGKGLLATQIGHPLINSEKCVRNNIEIGMGSFFIITGANMAGKSTFLRTIGLSLVMSNSGLPVFAEKMTYQPIKLVTSMRSSDSLKDDSSYFHSELVRLKYITEVLDNDAYFVILDEILKGTNSKDKEEGSKKFVERLIQKRATGIIATHDLGLCTIEQQFSSIKNYYFDAEVVNDELYFDYTMKEGVCKNMNASFLLRKMGIVEN